MRICFFFIIFLQSLTQVSCLFAQENQSNKNTSVSWSINAFREVEINPSKSKVSITPRRVSAKIIQSSLGRNKKTLKLPTPIVHSIEFVSDTVYFDYGQISSRPATFNILSKKLNVPIEAQEIRFKDNSNGKWQYIDIDQGLSSSYTLSVLNDSRGALWIGTDGGGVTKYNGETFTTYTDKDGLPNNFVRALFEDSKGDLWFGTYGGGFTRYDGYFFNNYSVKTGLSSNYIWDFEEDNHGNIWIATEKGVDIYDGDHIKTIDQSKGLLNENIRCLLKDSKGNMWLGGNKKGISKITSSAIINYAFMSSNNEFIIHDIMEDSEGKIWFASEGMGVYIYSDGEFVNYSEEHGLPNNTIRAIHQDRQGSVWLGHYGYGVSKLDSGSITNYTEADGLSVDFVSDIKSDDSGNLWVATNGGGLAVYNNSPFTNYTVHNGMSAEYVTGMVKDKFGNLWLSCYGGIMKYDGHLFTTYRGNFDFAENNQLNIFYNSSQELWIASFDKGAIRFDGNSFYYYDTNMGLSHNTIRQIAEDKEGTMWFASSGGGINKLRNDTITLITKENGLASDMTWCLLRDDQDNMWIGTDNGINIYDGEVYRHITTQDGLGSNLIRCLFKDELGHLWVGTYDNGISVYNGKTFQVINTNSGLSNNIIWSITSDNYNNIWVATENGLNKIDIVSGTSDTLNYVITKYDKTDGLKANDFIHGSVIQYEDNCLLWGGGKSLVKLDLENLNSNPNIPQLGLEYILVNNKIKDFTEQLQNENYAYKKILTPFNSIPHKLQLPYNQNILTFSFEAIDWSSKNNIKYQYYMEGYDKSWSKIQKTHTEKYTLPYGSYTLKARAQSRSSLWSEVLSYPIEITPPWWHTWWARFLFLASLVGLVYLFIYYRINQSIIQQNRLSALIKTKTIELEVKNNILEEMNNEKDEVMNVVAHDLRSPLNKIDGFLNLIQLDGNTNSNQKDYLKLGKQMVVEGKDLIINILDAYSGKRDQLELSEIKIEEFITNWLHEFDNMISNKKQSVHYTSTNEINSISTDTKRLRRILDNFMTNAIKFSEEGKLIEVRSFKEDNKLVIGIKDQGPGISTDDQSKLYLKYQKLSARPTGGEMTTGLGLSIVKKIAEELEGSVRCESKLGHGAEFMILLPIF